MLPPPKPALPVSFLLCHCWEPAFGNCSSVFCLVTDMWCYYLATGLDWFCEEFLAHIFLAIRKKSKSQSDNHIRGRELSVTRDMRRVRLYLKGKLANLVFPYNFIHSHLKAGIVFFFFFCFCFFSTAVYRPLHSGFSVFRCASSL